MKPLDRSEKRHNLEPFWIDDTLYFFKHSLCPLVKRHAAKTIWCVDCNLDGTFDFPARLILIKGAAELPFEWLLDESDWFLLNLTR